MNETSFERATKWLQKRCKHWTAVAANRRGYTEFVAYLFRLERPDKPDVCYVLDIHNKTIRRLK